MKTVLIVDDEYAVAEVLATLLADEGYAVRTACDGFQALERLKEEVPDLVITDQMMPVLGGAELFRAMRKVPAYREVPVILMSSVPSAAPSDRLPWSLFLQKPFDFAELCAWLRAYFRRRPTKRR